MMCCRGIIGTRDAMIRLKETPIAPKVPLKILNVTDTNLSMLNDTNTSLSMLNVTDTTLDILNATATQLINMMLHSGDSSISSSNISDPISNLTADLS